MSEAEQKVKPPKTLGDPRRAARVGQAIRRATKTLTHSFEELDASLAAEAGLGPGDMAEVEYSFAWKPFGWGMLHTMAEQAMRQEKNNPQTVLYEQVLRKVVQSSNFGLEEGKFDEINPDVMEWVLQTVGLKEIPDAKKSGGSSGEDNSRGSSKTQEQSPPT